MAYILDEFGNDPSQGLYLSVLGLCPLNLLYDQWTQDCIVKYLFCEKFPTTPAYSGSYEDLPAFWVDFCNIMSQELALCDKEKMRLERGKVGKN
jgi:hypothetical protein